MKQFQYIGWPEEGIPDNGGGLIDLIGQVQKWQRSSGDKPIVVHCRLVSVTESPVHACVASFPGLPFLPSVCVHNNTREWKTGEIVPRSFVLL